MSEVESAAASLSAIGGSPITMTMVRLATGCAFLGLYPCSSDVYACWATSLVHRNDNWTRKNEGMIWATPRATALGPTPPLIDILYYSYELFYVLEVPNYIILFLPLLLATRIRTVGALIALGGHAAGPHRAVG
jgi:hypothetical protein